MPARTKRRAKFDFRGRAFVWWVDNDRWLRIASADKTFVVAYALGRAIDQLPTLGVHGHEFPGLSLDEPRPVWLAVPESQSDSPLGSWVAELLAWSFDADHQVHRLAGPPRFS